jgi:hypothetical protein
MASVGGRNLGKMMMDRGLSTAKNGVDEGRDRQLGQRRDRQVARGTLLPGLRKIAGDSDVLAAPEILNVYAHDGTTNWIYEPEVVIFPKNT